MCRDREGWVIRVAFCPAAAKCRGGWAFRGAFLLMRLTKSGFARLIDPTANTSNTVVGPARRSPNLHSSIDDDIDAGHVRTVVAGQEQSDVGHFFGPAETTQQRLTEHVAGPFWVLELLARLVGFDHSRRNRIGTNPMLAAFHRQLPRH